MTAEIRDTAGNGSYSTYGWRIPEGEHSAPMPEIKQVRVSVPHSSKILDFTTISGSKCYEEREIEISFVKYFASVSAMSSGLYTFTNWLNGLNVFYDDLLNGYKVQNCLISSLESETYDRKAIVQVSFVASPFLMNGSSEVMM